MPLRNYKGKKFWGRQFLWLPGKGKRGQCTPSDEGLDFSLAESLPSRSSGEDTRQRLPSLDSCSMLGTLSHGTASPSASSAFSACPYHPQLWAGSALGKKGQKWPLWDENKRDQQPQSAWCGEFRRSRHPGKGTASPLCGSLRRCLADDRTNNWILEPLTGNT